jgi:hypothetical protein
MLRRIYRVWVSGCNKRGIEKQTKYIVEGKKESKTQLLVSPTRANVAGEQAGEQRRVPPTPHIQTQVNSTQISNRNPNPIPLRTRNSYPRFDPPQMRRRLPSMSPAPPNAGGDLFAANHTGALLALASSAFIRVSFIVKKKAPAPAQVTAPSLCRRASFF